MTFIAFTFKGKAWASVWGKNMAKNKVVINFHFAISMFWINSVKQVIATKHFLFLVSLTALISDTDIDIDILP